MDASKANRSKNTEHFKPSKALRAALRTRGKHPGTVTYFYSAKNDRDVVVPSDLQFALGVLLEADESVRNWDSDPDRVVAFIEHEGHVGSIPDAIITRWSGQVEFIEAKYTSGRSTAHARFQEKAQAEVAALVGATWSSFSEVDVAARQALLFDWLHIIPILKSTRAAVKARYEWLASSVIKSAKNGVTLEELRRTSSESWEISFATTFRLVQQGILHTDLDARPLSPRTLVTVRERRGG